MQKLFEISIPCLLTPATIAFFFGPCNFLIQGKPARINIVINVWNNGVSHIHNSIISVLKYFRELVAYENNSKRIQIISHDENDLIVIFVNVSFILMSLGKVIEKTIKDNTRYLG